MTLLPRWRASSGSADVVRLQTEGSTLQAVELFAIKNDSNPPRTLASPATFDFVLPDGAQIDGAHAQAPNGQPISVQAKPSEGEESLRLFVCAEARRDPLAGCLSSAL